MRERDDEFYVGYLPQAPAGFARRARLAVIVIVLLAGLLAVVLVRNQGRFSSGVFEFGVVREWTGIVQERPYPVLWVPRPGGESGSPQYSGYLLVAFGKHGAAEPVQGLDGTPVKLRGSLIHQDNRVMIEIADNGIEVLTGNAPDELDGFEPPAEEPLGERALVGEIVDSKCFLGVMKPGDLKPHRACAARCISGGVPPVLLVRDKQGLASYFLLATEDGQPLFEEVLDFIAEPVEIRGAVVSRGSLLFLRADPSNYRRIESDR